MLRSITTAIIWKGAFILIILLVGISFFGTEGRVKLSVDLTSRLSAHHFLEQELANLKKTQSDHAHEALLIWSSLPALVVSGSDTRLPQFARAQAQLKQLGIEVVRRSSGGTAVPQGPGVVNVSRIFSPPMPRNIEQLYQEFCRSLAVGFKAIGLETSIGKVRGSYCDGRYNLVSQGRKLAGTAMKLSGRLGAPSAVLAHAVILADMTAKQATERVNLFYQQAGSDKKFEELSSTWLVQEMGRVDHEEVSTVGDVAAAMQVAFSR